jgi:putative transposase
MLGDCNRFYEETDCHFVPTPAKYKKEAPFLKEVDSLALANAQVDLNRAFSRFFKNDGTGFPKFKSKKKAKTRYTTNCQTNVGKDGTKSFTVYVRGNYIRLPKVGEVRIAKHRSPKNGWMIKSATVERTPTGKYYISVLFEFQKDVQPVEVKHPVRYAAHVARRIPSRRISPFGNGSVPIVRHTTIVTTTPQIISSVED